MSLTHAVIALLALSLAGLTRGHAAAALPLPCPTAAGWRVERQISLPRRGPAGEAIGGFSAVSYQQAIEPERPAGAAHRRPERLAAARPGPAPRCRGHPPGGWCRAARPRCAEEGRG